MSLPTSTGGRIKSTLKEANVKKKTLIAPKNFKARTSHLQLLYKRLSNLPDPSRYLHVVADPGLYKIDAVDIWISPEDVVSLMMRKWLDINVIAWFQIMLHSVLQTREKDQCAFINPHDITSRKCKQYIDHPASCMVATMHLLQDKLFFLAPYWQSDHWTLFVICPSQHTGYILDSLKYEYGRTVDDFILKPHVEAVVTKYHTEVGQCDTGTSRPMTWTLAECNQQRGGWECGYYVLKWMYDFVMIHQNGFPNKNVWNDITPIPNKSLDDIANVWASKFVHDQCLKDVVG